MVRGKNQKSSIPFENSLGTEFNIKINVCLSKDPEKLSKNKMDLTY